MPVLLGYRLDLVARKIQWSIFHKELRLVLTYRTSYKLIGQVTRPNSRLKTVLSLLISTSGVTCHFIDCASFMSKDPLHKPPSQSVLMIFSAV